MISETHAKLAMMESAVTTAMTADGHGHTMTQLNGPQKTLTADARLAPLKNSSNDIL
jgi:hypothetical protein